MTRAIGFAPRQSAATLAWMATTTAVTGLALGLPLGVTAGVFVWRRVAEAIDVADDPSVPLRWLAMAIPCAVLAAVAAASGRALATARLRLAEQLRQE
jgi:hypothetical protein